MDTPRGRVFGCVSRPGLRHPRSRRNHAEETIIHNHEKPLCVLSAGSNADYDLQHSGGGAVGCASRRAAYAGKVTAYSQGLYGYIEFGHDRVPPEYCAGMGFYAAVWSLVEKPLANFQIGLPSSWIQPDNSDNKDQPLAPEGTLARRWKDRGPTWGSVFQTVEGGLGYWAGNRFRYGPPKFSMNGTPQCYDYEVGSPGWSFFRSNEALPDNRLGIAQLSNRLLIPPDALPFQGTPNGEFLGYTWMALPFTQPTTGDPPTGDQSWTCFLSAANFKGPIAYYIPETWSKIGKLFDYPFLHGRGLDARPGIMGGGAMEINTVPRFDAKDAQGTVYSKLPKLRFPTDAEGRAFLVQDVTYYSKQALYDDFKAWRDGGRACSGQLTGKGALQTEIEHPHDPLQPGGQEDRWRGACLRHPDFRRQCLGPAMVIQRCRRQWLVPAILQGRRGPARRGGGGGRAGGNRVADPGVQAGRNRRTLHLAQRPGPGLNPAPNLVPSPRGSSMARW